MMLWKISPLKAMIAAVAVSLVFSVSSAQDRGHGLAYRRWNRKQQPVCVCRKLVALSVVCSVIRSCRVVTKNVDMTGVIRAAVKKLDEIRTWLTFHRARQVCCVATGSRRLDQTFVNKAVDNHSRLMQCVGPRLGSSLVEVASC